MSGAQICPQCGRIFTCGMAAGAARCWCADLPVLAKAPEPGAKCLCPDCLRRRLAEQHQSAQQ